MSEVNSQGSTGYTTIQVHRAREGDADSVAWMVRKYSPFVAGVIRRTLPAAANREGLITVPDLVNDTWLRFLANIHKVKSEPGARLTPVAIEYLRAVALNVAMEAVRFLGRQSRVVRAAGSEETTSGVILVADDTGVGARAEWNDSLQRFDAALKLLTDEQRTVLVLRILDDKSPAEVGERLGKSANAVTLILHKVRELLRNHLGETYLDDMPDAR